RPARQGPFTMSDSNRRLCLQAKLKGLIERASSAADANLHCRRKPYPLGFAVRANGSKFSFTPESIEDEDNDTVVAHIRTLFLQNTVVSRCCNWPPSPRKSIYFCLPPKMNPA